MKRLKSCKAELAVSPKVINIIRMIKVFIFFIEIIPVQMQVNVTIASPKSCIVVPLGRFSTITINPIKLIQQAMIPIFPVEFLFKQIQV
jgi:hypothetical protein